MEPGATPRGTQIFVRGSPFDMVERPGLQIFLQMACANYVVFLYTMGDQEYTQAVLRVIDPEGKYFKGGVCTWRSSESRMHKTLSRPCCDRRMALIVDDSIDVWSDAVANLCLTRRFVGDKLDDGLQLLGSQLSMAHRAFYADAPPAGYSLHAALTSPQAPPTVHTVLADARGQVLVGCVIALTGVVSGEMREGDSLDELPLSGLIRLYGGVTTLAIDAATHLVARNKEGWRQSAKIRRGLSRVQEGADGDFHLVWDGWLLDTLSSWQRQPEEAYAIVDDGSAEEAPSEHAAMTSLLGAPRLRHAAADETQQRAQAASEQPASDPSSDDAGNPTSGGPGLPPRKRPRPEPAAPGANGRVHQYGPAPSVASYLQQQNGLLSVAITADAQ